MVHLSFTPCESAMGGFLIGLAAALALVIDGRIAGISGVLGPFLRSLVAGQGGGKWRALFLIGLVLGGLVHLGNSAFAFPEVLVFSPVRYIAGGLAVGVGTRAGKGCTSGHGVCGMARLSLRSWVAVPTFMAVAAITVYLTGNLEAGGPRVAPEVWPPSLKFPAAALLISLALIMVSLLWKPFAPLASGMIFGLGLGCAGMTSQAKVLAFLDVTGVWDPSLAFVMGGALCLGTFPAFAWARRSDARPLAQDAKFEQVQATKVDSQLLGGAAMFGVGWGLCGICPGPSVAAVLPYLLLTPGPGALFALHFVCTCIGWFATDRVLSKPAQAKEVLGSMVEPLTQTAQAPEK